LVSDFFSIFYGVLKRQYGGRPNSGSVNKSMLKMLLMHTSQTESSKTWPWPPEGQTMMS